MIRLRIKKSHVRFFVLVIIILIATPLLAKQFDLKVPSITLPKKTTPTPTKIPQPTKHPALTFPKPNATEKERTDYGTVVSKNATKTTILDITGCKPDPVVLETVRGTEITVKNDDATAHTISTDATHIFEIPAKGELKVTLDMGETSGIYAYGCDNSPEGVGVFALTD